MRGAFLVDKTIVDEIGGGLREAGDGAIASGFGRFGNFGELGKIGNVRAGSEPIKMLFEKVSANSVEFGERHAAGFGARSFVYEDDGFGFDAQAAMMRKDAGDVNPVSVTVFVRRASRRGIGDEAEGKTALAIVVDGVEANFIVAFVYWAVVDEFCGVEQMEAVHATPA